ncbi:MAG: hypothetical protein PHI23_01760, partial [Candidatus Peribacteraceae bacterium]|nr:hypothetical protein [Candidatus Peribacteraceae bacterium]
MPFQTRRVTDARKRPFPWRRTLVSALSFARPLTRWYLAWKEEKEKETKRKKRTNLLKRVLIVLLAVLCALLLLAGTVRALVSLRVLSFRSLVSVTGTELPRDADG